MMELRQGSSFDNRKKETDAALDWFKRNLFLRGSKLYWQPYNSNGRKRSSVYSGQEAGCISARGYIQVRMGKEKFMAHRIIWALIHGAWPTSGIDHINGDRLDNRIENMRDKTQFDNCKNAAKYPRREPWIATGVSRRGSKFYASAQVNNQKLFIGTYNCHSAEMMARKLFDQMNGFSDRHGSSERVCG